MVKVFIYGATDMNKEKHLVLIDGKEKTEETFSFIPDRTCSSLCNSCNGNHSVAVWKPAS